MNSNNFEKKKSEILNLFEEKKFDLVIRLGTNLLKKKTNDPQNILLCVQTIFCAGFFSCEVPQTETVSYKHLTLTTTTKE